MLAFERLDSCELLRSNIALAGKPRFLLPVQLSGQARVPADRGFVERELMACLDPGAYPVAYDH